MTFAHANMVLLSTTVTYLIHVCDNSYLIHVCDNFVIVCLNITKYYTQPNRYLELYSTAKPVPAYS